MLLRRLRLRPRSVQPDHRRRWCGGPPGPWSAAASSRPSACRARGRAPARSVGRRSRAARPWRWSSNGFARREYGGAGAVGRTLSLDGHPFRWSGVAEPSFTGISVGALDVYVPLCAMRAAGRRTRRRCPERSTLVPQLARPPERRRDSGAGAARSSERWHPRSSRRPCRRPGAGRAGQVPGADPGRPAGGDRALRATRALRPGLDDPDGVRRPGAAGRVRQHRQPPSGARRRTAGGERDPPGPRRRPRPPDPPAPDRDGGPVAARCRRGGLFAGWASRLLVSFLSTRELARSGSTSRRTDGCSPSPSPWRS